MSDYKFEPFQPVLVRIAGVWTADFFSHLVNCGEDLAGDKDTRYETISGCSFEFWNILPYDDDTKHLLGTKDEPKPKWHPKQGEAVLVRNSDVESWKINFFVDMYEEKYVTSSYEALVERAIWKQCKPLHVHFNVPEDE